MNKIGTKIRKEAEKWISRPDTSPEAAKRIKSAVSKGDSSALRALIDSMVRKGF